MNGVLFPLMRHEAVFFELFERSARNVQAGAVALQELFEDYSGAAEKTARIKAIEHAGDELTHDTFARLEKTLVTPFDREDIHGLCSRLDDIIDAIDTAAERMVTYQIPAPTEHARRLSRALRGATELVVDAVERLRQVRQGEELLAVCETIHQREKECDALAHAALAALFTDHDATEILKWKDVYQDLELAVDRCDDVANVLETLVIKSG